MLVRFWKEVTSAPPHTHTHTWLLSTCHVIIRWLILICPLINIFWLGLRGWLSWRGGQLSGGRSFFPRRGSWLSWRWRFTGSRRGWPNYSFRGSWWWWPDLFSSLLFKGRHFPTNVCSLHSWSLLPFPCLSLSLSLHLCFPLLQPRLLGGRGSVNLWLQVEIKCLPA